MHILYFHQHFTTPKGSTGIRSYTMARSLIARGHKVTMVCGSFIGSKTGLSGEFIRGKRRGYVDGIDVIELDLRYGNIDSFLKRTSTMLRYVIRSLAIALIEKHDLVFATSTPLTAGIPGLFSRIIRNKPFVFEVRDLWPELPKKMGVISNPIILGLMSLLEWVSYRFAGHVIALSPGIVEGVRKRGVHDKKITLVPNGCDLEMFSKQQAGWRPPEVGDQDFLALFSGTHGVANGLDKVMDAAEELKNRRRNDIKIILIGQGKTKEELIQRSRKLRLDNVIFLDPVEKEKLAGLMSESDIGLQVLANVPAFYYGTSPNKFFDYISAGLPVLNNYPGWLAELILEHDCGFVVQADDPCAFADSLELAAADKVSLKAKGVNARNLASRHFDRKSLASAWIDVLEDEFKRKR